ncbi:MAG: heavy-metal-associated domain-containing protein [Acidimicrobiales bacterium]
MVRDPPDQPRARRARGAAGLPLAEAEFVVPSMHCEDCAEKISTALSPVAGVREVRPKIRQKRVYVRYEPARIGEGEPKETLASSGFTAVDT